MKKIISIITLCAVCLTMTACGNTVKDEDAFSELELVKTEADRSVPYNLKELENCSDIAVVGEFTEDTEQELTFEYSEFFGKEILTIPRSYNTIKVTKVLMGDVNVGDDLRIGQFYGISDGELVTISDLTPMQKGDEWVFFLYREKDGTYWYSADSDSRFPTKQSASNNSSMKLAAAPYLGVYDKADFNEDIYSEIVEKYDV